jgi:hypothetical protein
MILLFVLFIHLSLFNSLSQPSHHLVAQQPTSLLLQRYNQGKLPSGALPQDSPSTNNDQRKQEPLLGNHLLQDAEG